MFFLDGDPYFSLDDVADGADSYRVFLHYKISSACRATQ